MTSYDGELGGDSEFQQQLQAHEDYVQTLTDEELEKLLDDTIKANEVLQTETEMFEKYLKRVDPNNTTLAMQAASKTKAATASMMTLSSTTTMSEMGLDATSTASSVSRLSRKSRTKSRSSGAEKMLKLSPEQKCDIAQREVEEYNQQLKRINEESNAILDNLQAIAEEADIRLMELKKEQYDFERELQQNLGAKKKKAMPSSEKVVHYIEDSLRDRESLIVKLRLKNTALKILKKKLRMQLKQKEEMGEVLHEIDFSQLKIENEQYIERIDERNRELMQLKLVSGRTTSILNSQKKMLNVLLQEKKKLNADIESRHDLLSHLEAEIKVIEKEKTEALATNEELEELLLNFKVPEEKSEALATNEKLEELLLDFKVPEVLDYVREKEKHHQLQKQIKIWERKNHIAEMTLKNQAAKLKKLNSFSIEPKKNLVLPPIKR